MRYLIAGWRPVRGRADDLRCAERCVRSPAAGVATARPVGVQLAESR
jgi:hypothetical protein